MPNKKSELTDTQKIKLINAIIAQVVDIFTNNFYHIFEEDADIAFSTGGCESLAIILKELFPEGEILYDSNHSVFSLCGKYFDINGSHDEGRYANDGSSGFYPISDWTKKEFAPIIGYSLARIRQRYPYFWDETDTFDKTAEIENGPYITYKDYIKSKQDNPRGF